MMLQSKSLERLATVHPDLARVISEAAATWIELKVTWQISEGLRSLERQKQLFAARKTRTLRSRHLRHPKWKLAMACDFVVFQDGEVTWDFKVYKLVGNHIKAVAKKLKIPIEWGGDWTTFKDGPHIQLPWKEYP